LKRLNLLALTPSGCLEHLQELCHAHTARFPKKNTLSRPEKLVKEIISSGLTEFSDVFKEFSRLGSIYGFGDTQVKSIYDKVKKLS